MYEILRKNTTTEELTFGRCGYSDGWTCFSKYGRSCLDMYFYHNSKGVIIMDKDEIKDTDEDNNTLKSGFYFSRT